MRLFISIIVASLFLVGCTKEIDLDLNDSEPRLVIEANVHDGSGPQVVKLSRSMNFDNAGQYPQVSGAQVSVTDGQGNVYSYIETSAGVYESAAFTGVVGETYILRVVSDGENYTATCRMPEKVLVNELRFNSISFPGSNEDQFAVLPVFTDPIRSGNAYRILLGVNEELDNSYYVYNDNVGNGQENAIPLFSNELDLLAGDTVKVEFRCIDVSIYDYYYLLSIQSDGGTAGVSPANPPSNIQGNKVVGYFSAHTVQSIEAIIP